MKLALIVSLVILITSCLAQSKLKDTRISLDVKEVSFEALIENLRSTYHVNIMYGVDRLQTNRRISIKVANVTLEELMKIICSHYNLSFEFYNKYVLLNKDEPKQPLPSTLNTGVVSKPVAEAVVLKEDTVQITPTSPITVLSIRKDEKKDSVVFIEVIQKQSPDTIATPKAAVQKNKIVRHTISAFLFAEMHQYHFKELADLNQSYTSSTTFGYSVSYSISITKKMSLGLGVSYSAKDFSYNRNFRILFPEDPVSIPDVTTLSYKYLEFPLEINYQVMHSRNALLNLISGVNSAFLISKSETTQYLTQGDPNTKYFIDSSNAVVFGMLAGIRFSYKIYKSIGIFLEPRYIKNFSTVNSAVMSAGTDLFRINSGIVVNLNHSR